MGNNIKNKRGLELVTDAFHVTKQLQKYSFICYILSYQVWWCNVKQFLSYSKNYTCKFMQVNWWHRILFHFHLSFWIWKVWKGKGKINKKWISWERKDLLRLNKTLFTVFKGLSLGEKLQIWWKIAQALM